MDPLWRHSKQIFTMLPFLHMNPQNISLPESRNITSTVSPQRFDKDRCRWVIKRLWILLQLSVKGCSRKIFFLKVCILCKMTSCRGPRLRETISFIIVTTLPRWSTMDWGSRLRTENNLKERQGYLYNMRTDKTRMWQEISNRTKCNIRPCQL